MLHWKNVINAICLYRIKYDQAGKIENINPIDFQKKLNTDASCTSCLNEQIAYFINH